jgi:hypothetical protein
MFKEDQIVLDGIKALSIWKRLRLIFHAALRTHKVKAFETLINKGHSVESAFTKSKI